MLRKPAPKVPVRCPKCTRGIMVSSDAPEILCPTCGYVGARAPGDWEAENLDGIKAGRQQALHGRPRPTGTVILLTLVTFGIYALVYAYKAFKELDDQHGRLHATWWYLFGVLLFPLLVPIHIYWCIELRRLQVYRKSRGLRPRLGPLGYSLWVLLLPVVGFIVALALINNSVADVWSSVHKETKRKPLLA